MTDFSDYIVYADESGDHGLVSIDPEYPVFALTFCIIRKENYIDVVDPAYNASSSTSGDTMLLSCTNTKYVKRKVILPFS